MKFDIKKAHSNEIDDLDVHPNSKYVRFLGCFLS